MAERKPLTQEQKDRKNQLARERRARQAINALPPGRTTPLPIEAYSGQEISGDGSGHALPLISEALDFQQAEIKLLAQPEIVPGLAKSQQGAVPPAIPVESSKDTRVPTIASIEAFAAPGEKIPTPPPFKGPKFLISSDHKVYTNPQHPDSNGALTFIGFHLRVKGKDGQMEDKILELAREPANKKERRKAKAGLPFRDKKGVLA